MKNSYYYEVLLSSVPAPQIDAQVLSLLKSIETGALAPIFAYNANLGPNSSQAITAANLDKILEDHGPGFKVNYTYPRDAFSVVRGLKIPSAQARLELDSYEKLINTIKDKSQKKQPKKDDYYPMELMNTF